MSLSAGDQVPIRTVSSLTGVNAITLRAWERRYGLIEPLRTPKGHRLYTHEHIERIRRVLALLERGVPISQARTLIDQEAKPVPAGPQQGPWRAYLDRMLAAISRFDEPELDHVYDEALSIHPIEQMTRQLLLPLFRQVGERWTERPGGIAEEHFFSTHLRSRLGTRLQHRMRYAAGPKIVAACAPGEQHDIGLLLFALEANGAGMRTVVLGADTPLQELAIAQRASGADGVVISCSLEPAPGLLQRDLPKLVRELGVPIFIGGASALRHRQTIAAAGAVPLGIEVEDGARLVATTLNSRKTST